MDSNETTTVLCWNNGGHLIIDDVDINDIFNGSSSFTFECWALPDKELVYNKNKMVLLGQYDDRNKIEYKSIGLYNLDTPSYGSKDEPRPKYIGMKFDKNQIKGQITSSDIVGYHHYVFTFDKDKQQRSIYIDGKLIIKDGNKLNEELCISSGSMMIGHSEFYYFGGIIRDIRIWNTARTPSQIYKYYNISFKTELSIKPIIDEIYELIKQCKIFIELDYPQFIIRLIAEFDGNGLCAIWPLVNNNLCDILHGNKLKLPKLTMTNEKNPICWIKDIDFLPLGYGQYLPS